MGTIKLTENKADNFCDSQRVGTFKLRTLSSVFWRLNAKYLPLHLNMRDNKFRYDDVVKLLTLGWAHFDSRFELLFNHQTK